MSDRLRQARARALRALVPPANLPLAGWLEETVKLPASVASVQGPLRLWPFQRGIADAISDPDIERLWLVKPTRVGFTTLLTGTIASYVANDPCPIGVYQPTEDDCRDYMVSDIEPVFEASPKLHGKLSGAEDENGRNTLMQRRFAGGSLKLLAAKAERNFRRHNFRVLLMDEIDGMTPTKEGPPIDLAEKRTTSFRDRKIILGSTPTKSRTSYVLAGYAKSDRREYHCPCPSCGTMFELQWEMLLWEPRKPETVRLVCPACDAHIEERHKPQMVTAGDWVRTNPDVVRTAGFRMSAMISLMPNASWAHMVEEWETKCGTADSKMVFWNTWLGRGWDDEGETLDPDALEARCEAFGLPLAVNPGEIERELPEDCLLLTAGVDVQGDRLEVKILGWGPERQVEAFTLPQMMVLSQEVVWGKPEDEGTWQQLDAVLNRRYKHPLGGEIRVLATCVDSGAFTDHVYAYCFPRSARRVYATKGQYGWDRPTTKPSSGKIKANNALGRLYILGVDGIKRTLTRFLDVPGVVRFSVEVLRDSPNYFDQLTSEYIVTQYQRGQPRERWERRMGAEAEALDCFVYAYAARSLVQVDWEESRRRCSRLATPARRLSDMVPTG